MVTCALVGCVTAETVETRTVALDEKLQSNHEGAVACAPRELAEAEAAIAFCRTDSQEGNTISAEDHLIRAEQLVGIVLQKSTGSSCEGDRDGDGIPDTIDRCPDIPEDFDNENDEDGCPDFDRDEDGVADDRDKCPDQKEDKDGFQDGDGCPEFDNDRDGLMDASDQCPNKSEDFDGFQDLDGCPDLDNDGDDIPDVQDRCPNRPGPVSSGGCADEYKHIIFRDEQIELRKAIFFKAGTSRLEKRSFAILNEIGKALKTNKRVKVRIEGHTDAEGPSDRNLKLSTDRAKTVRRYLLSKGVAAGRLEAMGYGEDRPIDENDTPEGRATNRRVEFHIVK
ncbi:MAG: outer membrane protein OmpA-like peptidoglycan-associated protein [Myxococcota bacterium]